MERPSKRQRLFASDGLREPKSLEFGDYYNRFDDRVAGLQIHDHEDEYGDEDEDGDIEEDEASYEDPDVELQQTRAQVDNKLKSAFEAIFEKYGKDFTGIGDEIDLRTGEIVVDNGHLVEMEDERDAGDTGRGRSMLRAFTQEPEDKQRFVEDADDEEGDEDESLTHGSINLEDIEEDDLVLYQSSTPAPLKRPSLLSRPSLQKAKQRNEHRGIDQERLIGAGTSKPTSEPDVLSQFDRELEPQIVRYVSQPHVLDDTRIEPAWRAPGLAVVTPGKRPILKSILLQPERDRSLSPQRTTSVWAPKMPRGRPRKDGSDVVAIMRGDPIIRKGRKTSTTTWKSEISRDSVRASGADTNAARAQIVEPAKHSGHTKSPQASIKSRGRGTGGSERSGTIPVLTGETIVRDRTWYSREYISIPRDTQHRLQPNSTQLRQSVSIPLNVSYSNHDNSTPIKAGHASYTLDASTQPDDGDAELNDWRSQSNGESSDEKSYEPRSISKNNRHRNNAHAIMADGRPERDLLGRKARTAFLVADDRMLLEFVAETKRKSNRSMWSTELWKELEAMNPRHSALSWCDRYRKKYWPLEEDPVPNHKRPRTSTVEMVEQHQSSSKTYLGETMTNKDLIDLTSPKEKVLARNRLLTRVTQFLKFPPGSRGRVPYTSPYPSLAPGDTRSVVTPVELVAPIVNMTNDEPIMPVVLHSRSRRSRVPSRKDPGNLSWEEAFESIEDIDPELHASLLEDAEESGESTSHYPKQTLSAPAFDAHEPEQPPPSHIVETATPDTPDSARVIPNSQSSPQDEASSPPLVSISKSRKGKSTSTELVEKFKRNKVEPSYDFSDDEDGISRIASEPHRSSDKAAVTENDDLEVTKLNAQGILFKAPSRPLTTVSNSTDILHTASARPSNLTPLRIFTSTYLDTEDIKSDSAEEAKALLISDVQKPPCVIALDSDDYDELSMGPDDLSLMPSEPFPRLKSISRVERQETPLKRLFNDVRSSPARMSTPKRSTRLQGDTARKSPCGLITETPGGTLRRCGENDFRCEREFCFRCK